MRSHSSAISILNWLFRVDNSTYKKIWVGNSPFKKVVLRTKLLSTFTYLILQWLSLLGTDSSKNM